MTKSRGIGRGGISKMTKRTQETILRHLKVGAFLKHAAEAAGIEYRTLKYWLERADAGEAPYVKFATEVRRLRAEDAIRSISVITRAQLGRIEGDWKAAAWLLERKFPQEFGSVALQAAAVSVRTAAAGAASGGTDDDHVTTVQFYLPDNGRRPQDEEDES